MLILFLLRQGLLWSGDAVRSVVPEVSSLALPVSFLLPPPLFAPAPAEHWEAVADSVRRGGRDGGLE